MEYISESSSTSQCTDLVSTGNETNLTTLDYDLLLLTTLDTTKDIRPTFLLHHLLDQLR